MKIYTTEAQERYFATEKEILFEDLLSEEEKKLLRKEPPGVDIWRRNTSLKKVALSKSLGQAASSLIQKKPLRLLYDCITQEFLSLDTLPFQGVAIAFSFDLVLGEERFHLESITPEHPTYIAVYGEDSSCYIKGELPYYFPKQLGYGYGDRLALKDFPYLIK